ncbi:MAG TPA: AAA family ATPase, partial [Candidatus Thalassarchaeum sp.]|nr:AAA family ATPase [Candidatus Thalassarchaeum sp.]
EIEPSALREIYLEVPEVSWDQVGGLEEVKERLKESIEWPLTKPEMFEHFGINPPRGIVLFGAPGTGKTLIAKAIANEAKANFKKAKQSSPSIVFLDEFESIAGMRRTSDGSGSDVMNRVVNQLLSSMDGVEGMEGVIVVAATNRPEMIDPALLRSGRFERVLHIPPPDAASIKQILNIHTADMPLGRFKLDDLAASMHNYTGADIEAICREAALIAMRAERKTVSKKHFQEAIGRVRPTVTDEMMQYYGRMESMLTSGLESVRRRPDGLSGIESV